MTDRPNILLILTDQQRADSLTGGVGIPGTLPRLQRLAREGCRFENAYTPCALCSPARASLLTGLYPHNHRMWNNCDMFQFATADLPDRVRLISQDMREAGYDCRYVGKWHVGTTKTPRDYGFEGMNVPGYGDPTRTPEYGDYLRRHGLSAPETVVEKRESAETDGEPLYGYRTGDLRAMPAWFLAETAVQMMNDAACRDLPFFLVLSLWDPHQPYLPPLEWRDRFSPADVNLPATLREDLSGRPLRKRWTEKLYPPVSRMSDDEWKETIARACAQAAFMDDRIGRVLDALDDAGASGNTAVFMTSDHGDMMGSHGGMFDKGPFMYEDVYRIPMIARWPGVTRPDSIVSVPVTLMDLSASILDAAGVSPERAIDGCGLTALLRGRGTTERSETGILTETHGHRYLTTSRMLRRGRWKYVFNASEPEELYDLQSDPFETSDLASNPASADRLHEEQAHLLSLMERYADPASAFLRRILS